MKIFTREIIETFANPIAEDSYDKSFEWLEQSLSGIVEHLRKKTPVLTEDYEILAVGDMLSSTSTLNSEIDIFLTFNSPQLELNSIKLSNNRFQIFWNKIKRAYAQSKEEKQSKRKRKKRQKQAQKQLEIPDNKYSIVTLKKQLFLYSLQTLEEGGIVYSRDKSIKIVARDELGVDINIYPAIKTEHGYKIYSENSNKFITYSFEEFHKNLTKKIEQCGDNFIYMIRVFKNLYFNINNSRLPGPFLIESLLYNCPNSLFSGKNFYETFIKILNYLHNVSFQNFVLINDSTKKIFTSEIVNESLANMIAFIRKIDELI